MLDQIIEPTLLLNESVVRANIHRISEKAKRNGVLLRPHFKTHQSREIGNWFREEGVDRICVSSLRMAAYFAGDGWTNITVAFPVNIRDHARINMLAEKVELHLLVESEAAVRALMERVKHPLHLWLKIDVGTGRTGIQPVHLDRIRKLISMIQHSHFEFEGFLAHAGHAYQDRGVEAIRKTYTHTTAQLRRLQRDIQDVAADARISYGDTPTISVIDEFKGIDELRAGNYVFYDLSQWQIGSCCLEDIGVCTAVPIVAKHPSRSEIVVHGGAVHLSKDSMVLNGETIYGLAVPFTGDNWSLNELGNPLTRMSQEHGIIRADESLFMSLEVGDLIGILPVHSCLTADSMGKYRTLDGRSIQTIHSC